MKSIVINVSLIVCILLVVLFEIVFKIMVKLCDYKIDNTHTIENNENFKQLFSSK